MGNGINQVDIHQKDNNFLDQDYQRKKGYLDKIGFSEKKEEGDEVQGAIFKFEVTPDRKVDPTDLYKLEKETDLELLRLKVKSLREQVDSVKSMERHS